MIPSYGKYEPSAPLAGWSMTPTIPTAPAAVSSSIALLTAAMLPRYGRL